MYLHNEELIKWISPAVTSVSNTPHQYLHFLALILKMLNFISPSFYDYHLCFAVACFVCVQATSQR